MLDLYLSTTDTGQFSGKSRMGYALAFSLALHFGAVLAFHMAVNTGIVGNGTNTFTIQDVALTKPIGTPGLKEAARPEQQAAVTSTTATAVQQTGEPAPVPGPHSEPTGGDQKTGSSLGLGMTHGYFSGLADGKSLRDDIRGYYFEMLEKINQHWWDQARLLKEPLRRDGIFDLVVQREGAVVSIRILQGTGSAEADRLLTEIISKASPLPPLPPSYEQNWFRAPLRIKAPLVLFRLPAAETASPSLNSGK